ncbi:hypothetical protein CSAL01_08627 [Colletotrichum salicis]|uniref:Uncharacterized protein n=1 Tax=Colletotrichum salicis TaxID=1209931 RepID=A0A135V8A5_9PEZI|nr:hypothetical protein CSAL01_08627 [Colletotrichum salicis]
MAPQTKPHSSIILHLDMAGLPCPSSHDPRIPSARLVMLIMCLHVASSLKDAAVCGTPRNITGENPDTLLRCQSCWNDLKQYFRANPHTLHIFISREVHNVHKSPKQRMGALYFAGCTDNRRQITTAQWSKVSVPKGTGTREHRKHREHSVCHEVQYRTLRRTLWKSQAAIQCQMPWAAGGLGLVALNTQTARISSSRPPDYTRASVLVKTGDDWARGRPTASLDPGDHEICSDSYRTCKLWHHCPGEWHQVWPREKSRRGDVKGDVKVRVCFPPNAVIWPPPPCAVRRHHSV